MFRIRLQNDPEFDPTVEKFPSLDLTVESRSGLHPVEEALLERLSHLGNPTRLLVLGTRTAAAAMAATLHWPNCVAFVHVVDSHHARSLRRHIERNGLTSRVHVVLAPFVEGWKGPAPACTPEGAAPEGGNAGLEPPTFDAAMVQLGNGDEPVELALEWMQEIQTALIPGARVIISAEKAAPSLLAAVQQAFHAGPGPLKKKKQVSVIAGVRRGPPDKPKSHAAAVTLTVPGGKQALEMITLPGVFSHRRVDAGAQALAESVECGPGDRVLDMGCGCGAVGLSLAVHRGVDHVTFLDSHARAVWCARENAQRNGFANADFLIGDTGLEGPPRFTVFAGNPPYFSQHKIDELFLQTALKTLLPGGRITLVAKNTDWLLPRTSELFADARLTHRRGYGIITALKKSEPPGG